MLRFLFCFLLTALTGIPAYAVKYTPTIPGTNIPDPTAYGMVVTDREAYYTFPSTDARVLSRGGYMREGNVWVPTLPSSNARDYSQPAYSSDPDSIVNSPLW